MKTIEYRKAVEYQFRERRQIYEPGGRPVNWRYTRMGLYPRDPELREAKEQEESLAHTKMLTDARVRQLAHRAEREGDAEELLAVVTHDISTVCKALTPYHEVLVYQPSRPVTVRWGVTPCEVYGIAVNGKYEHTDKAGHISIAAKEPTPREKLRSLGTLGTLPPGEQTFLHEKEHAMQFDITKGGVTPELIEAQAHRTRQITIAEFPSDALIDAVTRSPAYKDLDKDKFCSAVWSIDRLKALGWSEKKIATLISDPGKWNEGYGVWEHIEEAMQADIRARGMNELDVERAVMLEDLDRAIDYHEARTTTQGILYAVYVENLKPAALSQLV